MGAPKNCPGASTPLTPALTFTFGRIFKDILIPMLLHSRVHTHCSIDTICQLLVHIFRMWCPSRPCLDPRCKRWGDDCAGMFNCCSKHMLSLYPHSGLPHVAHPMLRLLLVCDVFAGAWLTLSSQSVREHCIFGYLWQQPRWRIRHKTSPFQILMLSNLLSDRLLACMKYHKHRS